MKRLFMLAWLGLFISFFFVTNSHAQALLKDRIGAFDLMCETPTGLDQEICALVQQVDNPDRQNARIVITIGKIVDNDSYFMRITAPLGIYLPRLLSLTIDGKPLGEIPFIRCWPNGCMSETALSGDLLSLLSKGNKAVFRIYPTPEEYVDLTVNLNGFTNGIKRLK